MTDIQRLWWRQASSDYELFEDLLRIVSPECHILHYLQMASEKIAKAYFWRSGTAPPKVHPGFIKYLLKALLVRSDRDLGHIAKTFGFAQTNDFEQWVKRVHGLAVALQNIAPTEAQDGPNPEFLGPTHPLVTVRWITVLTYGTN